MSKTRKQHIENLKGIEEIINYPNNKLALQYAIDHLSREWVSRKTHRKLVATLNKDRDEWQKKAIDRKSEIDHLKIDKEGFEKAYLHKQVEVSEWVALWEKESDKVSKLLEHRFLLSITSVALLISLLISLFKR